MTMIASGPYQSEASIIGLNQKTRAASQFEAIVLGRNRDDMGAASGEVALLFVVKPFDCTARPRQSVSLGASPTLEPFRFRWKRRTALADCLVVLLIGKPVPTFPEALFFAVLLIGKPVPTFPEAL